MPDDEKTGTTPGAGDAQSDTSGKIDVNAAAAKYRRDAKRAQAEAEKVKAALDEANAKLAEIEEANKTEAQKQLDAAVKKAKEETAAEWGSMLKEKEIQHALASELKDRGYPARLAALVETTASVGSVEDVPSAIDAVLKDLGWPERAAAGAKAPGFPGSPAPAAPRDDAPWDAARIARSTPEEINKNWDKIKAMHASGNLRLR
jgi:hypothetical protein